MGEGECLVYPFLDQKQEDFGSHHPQHGQYLRPSGLNSLILILVHGRSFWSCICGTQTDRLVFNDSTSADKWQTWDLNSHVLDKNSKLLPPSPLSLMNYEHSANSPRKVAMCHPLGIQRWMNKWVEFLPQHLTLVNIMHSFTHSKNSCQ